MQLDLDWSFMDFLQAASNRLDLIPSAIRAFNASGMYHFPILAWKPSNIDTLAAR